MTISEIFERFPTQKDCLEHLEKIRWDGDPKCPYCGSDNHVPIEDRHHCYTCKTSFRVTVGTPFHHTHLPLQKWFLALKLMLNAKKWISALQLSRDLNINKNTACRIHRQIRKAMARADQRKLLIGLLTWDRAGNGGDPDPGSHHRRVQGDAWA